MNKNEIKNLIQYLSIPSIASTTGTIKTAYYLEKLLKQFCDQVKLIGKENPTVWAKINGSGHKTVCFYGHYDVQPVIKKDWNTNPFQPVIKNSRIYARGSSDNKGQNFGLLMAIKKIILNKITDQNIKIILEGEEEIGSPRLKNRIIQNKKLFKANEYIIIDGSSPKNIPALYHGARGVVFSKIKLENSLGNLHSGKFSGLVSNPAHILIKALSKIINQPESYLPILKKEEGWTLDISNITTSGTQKMSIIPGTVEAIISIRTSPSINALKVNKQLEQACRKLLILKNSRFHYKAHVLVNGFIQKNLQKRNQYKRQLNKAGLDITTGILPSTLPIADIINEIYGYPPLILSFGNHHDKAHGSNESISLEALNLIEPSIKAILQVKTV